MDIFSPSDEKEEDVNSVLCKICVKSQSKYTCPRCGISYCSVTCYRSERHGECSEDFYRQCVLEEMKQEVGDVEAANRMKEILQRFQQSQEDEVDLEELDSDDESEVDLADRMCNVNLDDPDSVWEKLTDTEKQEFSDLVKSGNATKLLPAWKPWWDFKKERTLVVEIQSSSTTASEENTYIKNCPALKNNLPPLSQIIKTAPSPMVKNNVQNVLAAYCYVCRWFNGEHHSFEMETAQAFMALSCNLSLGNNYSLSQLAVDAVVLQVTSCVSLDSSPEAMVLMRQDLDAVLSGPEEDNATFYVLAALSDIHTVLTAAGKNKTKPPVDKGKEFSRQFPDFVAHYEGDPFTKANLKKCARKIEYYISWTKEYGTEMCTFGKKPKCDEIQTFDVDLDNGLV